MDCESLCDILSKQGEVGLLLYVLEEAGDILDRAIEHEGIVDPQLMAEPWLRSPDDSRNLPAVKATSLWLARWIKEVARVPEV